MGPNRNRARGRNQNVRQIVSNRVYTKGVFATPFSQPISLIFRTHAFQTAKRCVFFKKFLYESCLKNQINSFLKKKLANT